MKLLRFLKNALIECFRGLLLVVVMGAAVFGALWLSGFILRQFVTLELSAFGGRFPNLSHGMFVLTVVLLAVAAFVIIREVFRAWKRIWDRS